MTGICDKSIQVCEGLIINADSFFSERSAEISSEMALNGSCILSCNGRSAVTVTVKGTVIGSDVMLMLESILTDGQALGFEYCGMSFSSMYLKRYRCDIISGKEAFCELVFLGTSEVTAVEQ